MRRNLEDMNSELDAIQRTAEAIEREMAQAQQVRGGGGHREAHREAQRNEGGETERERNRMRTSA